MAYEDIYKGLTKEDKEKLLRQDVPKFEPTGECRELSLEEKNEAHKTLMKFIEKRKKGEPLN